MRRRTTESFAQLTQYAYAETFYMGIVTQSQLKYFIVRDVFTTFTQTSNKENIFWGCIAVNNLPQTLRKLP